MDLTWLSAILVGAGYLALGYFIGSQYPPRFLFSHKLSTKHKEDASLLNDNDNKKRNTKSKLKDPLEIEQLAEILDDFKMVLLKIPSFSPNPCTQSQWVASKIVPFFCRYLLSGMILKWVKGRLLLNAGTQFLTILTLKVRMR